MLTYGAKDSLSDLAVPGIRRACCPVRM